VLAGIRLAPVEDEISGQTSQESAKALQQLFATWPARYLELTRVGDANVDIVALFQLQRLDKRGRYARDPLRGSLPGQSRTMPVITAVCDYPVYPH